MRVSHAYCHSDQPGGPSATGYESVLQFSRSPTHHPLISNGNSYWKQPCLP